jgi:hypothetical protein
MKVVVLWLFLAVALVSPASGAEPVTRTLNAPHDRVWAVTEAVLKHQGWEIEKQDRTIGWITTRSRMIEGGDYGVYAKGTRHRLRLHLKAAGDSRTTVSVERTVFKRERILWMDNDEPLTVTDTSVEHSVLDAIGKAL